MSVSGSNNVTVCYVDLSTYDEIEELLYAGASAANIFHARITRCVWFAHIPIRLRNSSGTRNFGETFSFTQPRQGDYATYTWARITLPTLDTGNSGYKIAWADDLGHSLFKEIEFSVNDIPLQKYSQLYLEHRSQHSLNARHFDLYQNMIGNKNELTDPATTITQDTICVPMWAFYQKAGAAFPHSCIPYADVKWEFTLREFRQLVQVQGADLTAVIDATNSGVTPSLVSFELWTNYAVLTQDMRARMGAIPRQMLIDQVQEVGKSITITASGADETVVDLRFSYHMTWLTFVVQNLSRGTALVGSTNTAGYQFTNYTDSVEGDGNNPVDHATILYENSERLDAMPSDYWAWIVPFFHFEAGPSKTGFNTWSLAYYGNSYNPTGGLNASRLFNMSAKVVTTSAFNNTNDNVTSAKLLFLTQTKQVVLFTGGGIIIEFH